MYSSKDAANTPYPTQWALNPTAYQNMDSSDVDWATLAQQWIAMKEAAAIVAVPPPPSMKPDEEGEAPMEVENNDNSVDGMPPDGEWNSTTNSWSGNWNQWGWGWPGSGPEPKIEQNTNIPIPPIDNYPVATENTAPSIPGYTTASVSAPTFQHGYWTAPHGDQNSSRTGGNSRERRSKSKTSEYKPPRGMRLQREKSVAIPSVIEPIVSPMIMSTTTIDAAKRRQLPAWIREGLEKMEREKQRAIEKEQEKREREEAEREKKRLEQEELERLKAEASRQPLLPPKSKFESDSETEEIEHVTMKEESPEPPPVKTEQQYQVTNNSREDKLQVKKTKEEIMQEVMLAVRRSLTEILLEVTDHEIETVCQEELVRYNAAQASRVNAMKASKSKALAAIATGLGLGAYETSSGESTDEDQRNEITDQQLQDIIRRKRQEFERTARDIEAEVRRAEAKENEEATTLLSTTPERPRNLRSSATPPPIDGETPEKPTEPRIKDRRPSQKSTDKVDGIKRSESINDEKTKKSNKRDQTTSPERRNSNKVNDKRNSSPSTSTSDSENDSSSSSSGSSSESEREVKVETKPAKKRKRRSSSSSGSLRKSKKSKKEIAHKEEKNYKSKNHNNNARSDKSRRREDYDRYKRSSRDYDRYREHSEDRRKRARRSRSISYESSRVRRSSRDRSEERVRRRDPRRDREDRYDRYDRCRDRRTRSDSRSTHRR